MNKVVKKILIKTKKAVFSEIIGNNNSLFKGEGYDFVELREYETGEDIKKIDWMISAKMQKPYVKVFHAQKEQNIAIVPLLSGSMHFGTSQFKQQLLTEVCSLLGFSCIKQGDPFVSMSANEQVETLTKKSKKIFSVYEMAEKIDAYNCLQKNIDYPTITKELFKHIKKRSIIFLIGDFFEIEQLDLRLLSRKHEVICIIIRDHFEEDPKELGSVHFVDPSNAQSYDGVLNKSLIKQYRQRIKQNDHVLYEHFQSCGIRSVKIYTNDDPIVKLLKLMR